MSTATVEVPPQHMKALKKAQQVRLARAELKAELRGLPYLESRALAAEVIRRPPNFAVSWEVRELLCSVRRGGPHEIERYVRPAGIRDRRTLAQLTERQREVLADALRGGLG